MKTFQLPSLELASGTRHRGALLEAGEKEEAGSEISRYALTLDIFLLTCSTQQHRAPWSLLGGLLLSHTLSVARPGIKLCLSLQEEGTDGLGRAGLDSQGPDALPGSDQMRVIYVGGRSVVSPSPLSFLLLFQSALLRREVSVPLFGNCTKLIHFSSWPFEHLRQGTSFRLFLFEQWLGLGLEEDLLSDFVELA